MKKRSNLDGDSKKEGLNMTGYKHIMYRDHTRDLKRELNQQGWKSGHTCVLKLSLGDPSMG